MENDFSAIRSLQELKNLLDSGAITQEEYEALKKKIIFGKSGGEPATAMPGSQRAPAPETLGGDPVVPEYTNEDYVGYDASPHPSRTYNPDAIGPEGVGEGGDLAEPRQKDMLVTILITLGVLLLLGLIAYQLMSKQDSEKLTSISGPEELSTDTTTAPSRVIEPAATNGEITRDTMAAPATATTPDAEVAPIDANPATGTTTPATPSLSEEEILSRAKDRLESYYDDMRNPPFSAQRHFAAQVERYYTLVNTTPAAINENITTYHFPEFQDSEVSIEEGSMKASSIADGYEVTYIENGTALRKSKNQKQQTKARVRARFDTSFKMTYFRQEALLENTFVE
jgi:Short C-terminal domain